MFVSLKSWRKVETIGMTLVDGEIEPLVTGATIVKRSPLGPDTLDVVCRAIWALHPNRLPVSEEQERDWYQAAAENSEQAERPLVAETKEHLSRDCR